MIFAVLKVFIDERFVCLLDLLILALLLSSIESVAPRYSASRPVSGQSRCLEKEKQALLKFKEDLEDDYGLLSSWGINEDSNDCCQWRGVWCRNGTGQVIALDLSHARHGYYQGLRGKLGPSLLELQHLTYLDLSHIYFYGSTIPEFIGSLSKLQYLNLADSGFAGVIPNHLGNLSNLQILDLSLNEDLSVKNLEWLSHLSSLRQLYLNEVNLRMASDWLLALNRLPFLVELQLTWCELPVIAATSFPVLNSSSTSLASLDLSYNVISIELLRCNWLLNYSRIISIKLVETGLFGPIPEDFGKMISLEHLDLSLNQFEGGIPKSIGNLSSLRSLDLFGNSLNEPLLAVFHNLSGHLEKSLEYLSFKRNKFTGSLAEMKTFSSLRHLDLSENELNGPLPPSFWKRPKLLVLDLSSNTFRGELPDFMSSLSLRSLYLNNNELNGTIPQSISYLSKLAALDLSSNYFTGFIPEVHLLNLSKLKYLSLSKNQLNGHIPPIIGKLPKLEVLDLSSNQFQGGSPDFMPSLPLRSLRLNNNKLDGIISQSIGFLSELDVLDFSSNCFIGGVSEVHFLNLSKLHYLDLSYNTLVVELSSNWVPPFSLGLIRLANCKLGPDFPSWLQSQKFLWHIDISGSGIVDAIPSWFWDSSPELEFLNLSCNHIHGILPDLSFKFVDCRTLDLSSNNIEGRLPLLPSNVISLYLSKNRFQGSIFSLCNTSGFLSSVDLSDNLLSGSLPDCWMRLKQLSLLNLANNNFSGSIPSSIGSLHQILSLHLRNNSLDGDLPSSLQRCTNLSIVDLGQNKFTGSIPVWLGRSLQSLVILSLRSNQFYGSIPSEICYLKMIQILDLSLNNVSGSIPKCMKHFTTMARKGSSKPTISFVYDSKYSGDYFIYRGVTYAEAALLVWKGREFEYRNTLGLVKSVDLSSNKLTGDIPSQITCLAGLVALNLSRNNLTGKIPPDIGHLQLLNFIDLSRNQLSGTIPRSLSQLNYIGVLDLSNNNLSGRIPSSTQLQSFNASAYSGNPGLCGLPLPNLCAEDQGNLVPGDNQDAEIQGDEKIISSDFYAALGIGFTLGLWGTLGCLILSSLCRDAYFRLMDTILMSMLKMKRLLQR